MSDQRKRVYDLGERTAEFGKHIVRLVQGIPETAVTRPLISQITRSGTSVGANYMEADGAESKRDFIHKIKLCKKEAKETMHWLRMLVEIYPSGKEECRALWQEAGELVRIFGAITRTKPPDPH